MGGESLGVGQEGQEGGMGEGEVKGKSQRRLEREKKIETKQIEDPNHTKTIRQTHA